MPAWSTGSRIRSSATSPGTGLWLDLPGCEPRAAPPATPLSRDGPVETEAADEPVPVRTVRVELRLHPPIDAGRTDISSAYVTIPPGCRTAASLSAAVDLPVMGIVPTGRNHAVRIRPVWKHASANHADANHAAPDGQLIFLWSAVPGVWYSACGGNPGRNIVSGRRHAAGPIAISHRLSPAIGACRFARLACSRRVRVAIRAGAAACRISISTGAGRRTRNAAGVFSTTGRRLRSTATFVLPIDRHVKPLPLALLDPLRSENAMEKHVSLRFHQFALRQPSDLRIDISPPVSSAERDRALKPRPIKEFLKEWNAGGARPSQAFDLARLFALQLDIESLPAQPGVRASAEGHFRPGRLD